MRSLGVGGPDKVTDNGRTIGGHLGIRSPRILAHNRHFEILGRDSTDMKSGAQLFECLVVLSVSSDDQPYKRAAQATAGSPEGSIDRRRPQGGQFKQLCTRPKEGAASD